MTIGSWNFPRNSQDVVYGFIDAENVRQKLWEKLRSFGFENEEIQEFDFSGVTKTCNAKRIYLYCAIRKNGEPNGFVKKFQTVPSHIVRFTLLKKIGEKSKEEGVDVRLAVEAMQLAAQDKLSGAIIFSDDGDLLPLINALVDLGISTTVCAFGNPNIGSVSPRMRDSSDNYVRIGRLLLARCIPGVTTNAVTSIERAQEHYNISKLGTAATVIANSTIDGTEVTIVQRDTDLIAVVLHFPSSNQSEIHNFNVSDERAKRLLVKMFSSG